MDQIGPTLEFAFKHPVVFVIMMVSMVGGVAVALATADWPILCVPAVLATVTPGCYFGLKAMEKSNRDREARRDGRSPLDRVDPGP